LPLLPTLVRDRTVGSLAWYSYRSIPAWHTVRAAVSLMAQRDKLVEALRQLRSERPQPKTCKYGELSKEKNTGHKSKHVDWLANAETQALLGTHPAHRQPNRSKQHTDRSRARNSE